MELGYQVDSFYLDQQEVPVGRDRLRKNPEALRVPEITAHSDTLRFELPLCTPSDGGPSEGPSQKEGAAVHDATKRFEIETLRLPVSVGPTAMVEHETNKYSMPPEACGFPGTLHLFRDRVRIVAGRYHAEHPRLPAGSRGVSNLSAHRQAILEAVSGKRGRQYRMREHLFQLGPAAKAVITEIIYAEPRSWNDSIERLHELLQLYGDDTLRASFEHHRGQPGCRLADIARDQFPLPFRDGTNGGPR